MNTASGQPGVAANSWVTIYGTNLASTTQDWSNSIDSGKLPTTLAGVSVMIGNKRAYMSFVSPTQLNVLAPDALTGVLSGDGHDVSGYKFGGCHNCGPLRAGPFLMASRPSCRDASGLQLRRESRNVFRSDGYPCQAWRSDSSLGNGIRADDSAGTGRFCGPRAVRCTRRLRYRVSRSATCRQTFLDRPSSPEQRVCIGSQFRCPMLQVMVTGQFRRALRAWCRQVESCYPSAVDSGLYRLLTRLAPSRVSRDRWHTSLLWIPLWTQNRMRSDSGSTSCLVWSLEHSSACC